jgi:multiple sugar transport system ATP-binding protein
MTMADVIVILRDGYIEQVGKPMEVYDRPANLFVAEFIGAPTMNILRGTVETSGGAPAVRIAGGVALPLPEGARVASGQAIAYGVRPEHFHPSPNGGIEARINVVEPTGPEVHIYADLGGEEICAISRDRTEFTPGEAITLAPERGRVHLFDAETGRSLRS